MAERKYTREYCEKVVSTCTTKKELREGHLSLYNAIYRYGYQDLLEGLAGRNKRKLTYEECEKVVSTCTSKQELREKDTSVYNVIYRNGWKDLLEGLAGQNERPLTYEECLEAALKCQTIKEFYSIYPKEYQAAWRHGCLKKFTWLKASPSKWNVSIYAYIFPTLKTVYVGLTNDTERRNRGHKGSDKASAVYKFCQKNNLPVPDMTILISDIPADPDGRKWEDYYVKEYRAAGWNVLNKKETGPNASLGQLNGKLSRKKCYKLAKECKTRSEFSIKHPGAYQKSLKYGWDNDYYWFRKRKCKWTPELIWKEVYKYTSYNVFKAQSEKAYAAAQRRCMLEEIKTYYAQKKRA